MHETSTERNQHIAAYLVVEGAGMWEYYFPLIVISIGGCCNRVHEASKAVPAPNAGRHHSTLINGSQGLHATSTRKGNPAALRKASPNNTTTATSWHNHDSTDADTGQPIRNRAIDDRKPNKNQDVTTRGARRWALRSARPGTGVPLGRITSDLLTSRSAGQAHPPARTRGLVGEPPLACDRTCPAAVAL